MRLTVLSVGYPLAPVGPDSVGGAEQVLCALDRSLVRAGHRSLVVAPEGSRVEGALLPVPARSGLLDARAQAEAWAAHRAAIDRALSRERIDVVHLHGLDFHRYLPARASRVLVTLHLPPSWYAAEARAPRPRVRFVCVSASQRRASTDLREAVVIENGVPVDLLRTSVRKRSFVVALGRICPEKGFDLALDAATRAGVSCLLAGQVYGYADHLRYHHDRIVPRLDRRRRWVGSVGFARKRRLLSAARALLLPSLVPETSSLVAMEALACGTPVIAFPVGALPEIVDHGRTGFLVADVDEMAEAIGRLDALSPEDCRAAARARFSEERMASRYLALYAELARGEAA